MTESDLRLLLKPALQRVVNVERDTPSGFAVWIRYQGHPLACAGTRRPEEREAETDAGLLISVLTFALAEALSGDERLALDRPLRDDVDRAKTSEPAFQVEEHGHCDFCGERNQRVARSERPGTLGASRICLSCAGRAAVALPTLERGPGVPGKVVSAEIAGRGERLLNGALWRLISIESNGYTGHFEAWIRCKDGRFCCVGMGATREKAESLARPVIDALALALSEALEAEERRELQGAKGGIL